MVKKYARLLEERQINNKTQETWKIQDVPELWNADTRAKVEADGFYFEEDGTATKKPENNDK